MNKRCLCSFTNTEHCPLLRGRVKNSNKPLFSRSLGCSGRHASKKPTQTPGRSVFSHKRPKGEGRDVQEASEAGKGEQRVRVAYADAPAGHC